MNKMDIQVPDIEKVTKKIIGQKDNIVSTMECPICGQCTLLYDKHYKRPRCYNPECAWMPSVSDWNTQIEALRSNLTDEEILSDILDQYRQKYGRK
jgi:hypothetical protein